MEVCRRIYSGRMGMDSEKMNTLIMTRRLPKGELDLSWSIELGELENIIERYVSGGLSTRY
jgi:hypothetical protein